MTEHEHDNHIVNHFLESDNELPIYVIYQQLKGYPNEIDNMRLICLHCKSDHNQRVAMEYLYAVGLLEELHDVIAKNRTSIHKKNRTAALAYQLMYDRKNLSNKQVKPKMIRQSIKEINRIEAEADDDIFPILKDLLHIYCYFDMHQYGKIGLYNDRIKIGLDRLMDPLLRELLEHRLDETLFIYHWKRNELILSRKYGYRLLANTNNDYKKIDIHNMLAQGYLFESYEQAIQHAHFALELAKKTANARAVYGLTNYTIPFISAYYRKTEGLVTENKAEQAHIALANGNVEECISILEEFNELTPFQQYYLGMARKDKHLLKQSYQRFIYERDDYFYAKLPLQALNALDQ